MRVLPKQRFRVFATLTAVWAGSPAQRYNRTTVLPTMLCSDERERRLIDLQSDHADSQTASVTTESSERSIWSNTNTIFRPNVVAPHKKDATSCLVDKTSAKLQPRCVYVACTWLNKLRILMFLCIKWHKMTAILRGLVSMKVSNLAAGQIKHWVECI